MTQVALSSTVHGEMLPGFSEILREEALAFLGELHERFDTRRRELLAARVTRQARFDSGELPAFLEETAHIRADSSWKIAPVPPGLQRRHVEITGPVDRKMVINALNCGSDMFMADFEDANSPTWANCIEGQINLRDAIRREVDFTNEAGKHYALADTTATLLVRPRGWHLDERHISVGNSPISASLVDFGLYVFHNAHELLERGYGPWLYVPKLENHLEARLWNDVFTYAQQRLSIPHGSIKATVLIETITAAFEMDEILYELRDHAAGLNAGRWDYIFSIIKKFRNRTDMVLPDRAQITMTVPCMKAYCDLLVATCHKRGAHAMGGMAAFIPSRRDEAVNATALTAVSADKQREVTAGFDGTWVAHPDLVAIARAEFDAVLGDVDNQVSRMRDDVNVAAGELTDLTVVGGTVTLIGLRTNISVGIRYLAAWLNGSGAVAIDNLMEDAATAEISRSQVWQWVRTQTCTDSGLVITRDLVEEEVAVFLDGIRESVGNEAFSAGKYELAASVFSECALADEFIDFLTIPAYAHLD